MALPVVTAKSYDYGQYANPTPVKYRGGQETIGAAIGSAAATAGKMIADEKKADREATKKSTDTKVAFTQAVDPRIKANNELAIKDFGNRYGKLEYLRARNKISEEDYINQKSVLDTEFQYLKAMPEIFDKALDGEIDLSTIKGENGLRNVALHQAMSSGNVQLSYAEDGSGLMTWGKDGEYSAKTSDFIANTKGYTDIDFKFNFNTEDSQKDLSQIANYIDQKDLLTDFMTGVTQDGSKKALDLNKATGAIAESSYINAFVNKNGKDIAEDILGQDYINDPNKSGYEEQQKDIRGYIAAQVVGKVNQTGDRITTSTQSAPTGQQIKDAKALANFQKIYNIEGMLNTDKMETITEVVEEGGWFSSDKTIEKEVPISKKFFGEKGVKTPYYNEISSKLSALNFDLSPVEEDVIDKRGGVTSINNAIQVTSNDTNKSLVIRDLDNLTEERFKTILYNLTTSGTSYTTDQLIELMGLQKAESDLPVAPQS